jgi:hypothetical protein
MEQTRPTMEDVIADMNDDALAETAQDIREEGQRLLRMAGMAEHELIRRMIDRGATVLDTEHWGGKLAPGAPHHEYDDGRMMRLLPLLSEAEKAAVRVQPAPPPPRWDKRILNDLAKRGGSIRAVIEEATTTTRGEPRLDLKRKEIDGDAGD